METEKRLKMLQLFYAGVLADSVRRYAEAGILARVTEQKEKEQKMAAKGQLAQLQIKTPADIFRLYSEVFGCIPWNVEETEERVTATGNSCLLCSIAKKMDLPKPCSIYCINPVRAQIGALDGGYRLKVASTLWESDKCQFEVFREQ
jgi:hypothetical protein